MRVDLTQAKACATYSVDTRTLQPGDVFFALRGPNHDGNQYIAEALARGASKVIAEQPAPGPVIVVPDTLKALQQFASEARERWDGDVIAITGSAGKTSTKDVIAALLATAMPVGKTEGNFNNHVGLPLSVLRLPEDARVAVLEIGMNHAGEIRELAKIARPRIAVVTNVGYAHIEGFESIEEIASAKRELVEALPPDGIAVLNADDARVLEFRNTHPGPVVTYGLSEIADIRAIDVEYLPDGGARFRVGDTAFETSLTGRHGILNILAGIAVAGLYGIGPERLRSAVRDLKPGKMRGERIRLNGMTIFNDCYNSNPDAARAMLDVLRDTPARRRIAVLGEMLELGRWSECLHRGVGSYAVESGISVLVGIRGAAREMVDGAIEAGFNSGAAFFFEDPVPAGDQVRQIAREGDAILFKGSRGTQVERALERFLASP
ncbi:MAG: UDP-N-acetylmuramoyl-tripeptide--D-alanyl-D-alanine ligase [Bryobacteraceae bacterium]